MKGILISLTKRINLITLCLIFFLVLCISPSAPGLANQHGPNQTVLLISLDGFRWDYLTKYSAPNLLALAARGVRAKSLIPAFPSETFPNHYSIVTGVYPETHGIIANSFSDPQTNETFTMRSTESKWWGAEPIWITAEKQGQISAPFFWPGASIEIEGRRPTYWKPFDGHVPDADRVKTVLAWLALPEDKRPTIATLYFEDTDHAGHAFGPDSPEVAAAVKNVDATVGDVVKDLADMKLLDRTDIIVVSDHGMAAAHPEQVVYLKDYLDPAEIDAAHTVLDLYGLITPQPGKEDEVYQALLKAPHIKIYKKADVPARLHYRNNRLIPPLIALADEGWSIRLRPRTPDPNRPQRSPSLGVHGYDPALKDMQGIFIAAGPAFKQGVVVDSFENVQIYNVMAKILGLKPAPNAGSPDFSKELFR